MARERPVRTGAGNGPVGRIQNRGGLLGVQNDPEAASLSLGGRGDLGLTEPASEEPPDLGDEPAEQIERPGEDDRVVGHECPP